MSPRAALRELAALGIRIVLQGDGRVSLRAPESALTAEFIERLRQHKREIFEAARNFPKCPNAARRFSRTNPRRGGNSTGCIWTAEQRRGGVSGMAMPVPRDLRHDHPPPEHRDGNAPSRSRHSRGAKKK